MSVTGELSALYKIAYAKKAEYLIPEATFLTDLIKFVGADRQNGLFYECPVVLSNEAGFTYSLSSQAAYNLNDSIGMDMASAQVPGNDIVLAATMGTQQAARAAHDATAFEEVMAIKIQNILKSLRKRVEIALLYGQDGLATAAAQAVATTDPLAIVIDTAEWATGIWTGQENSLVVFSNKATGAVVDSLLNFRVARVDVSAKTVYFAAGTGSLANLETAIEANALRIHWNGTVSNNGGFIAYVEMAGLKKIISNTGSLFNINASTYDLWRGNTFTTTGQLNQQKFNKYISACTQRGLEGDAVGLVNPDTWSDLMTNQAAQRRFDSSYDKNKGVSGNKSIQFHSQNGVTDISGYNIVKEGDLFIFPPKKVLRVGAWEMGLADPTGALNGDMFFLLPTQNGVGMRGYTNQAVFVEQPAACAYVSGIVNSVG